MQRTLFAATLMAGLGLSGAAMAADVYATGGGMKDAPVYASATNWTGIYIGVGGGGGAVNHDIKASAGSLSGELNGLGGDGGFGTVEVGYDRQFGRFVAGIFFNYDFTSIGTKLNASGDGSFSASYDLDSLWSVGGRLGYLVNPSTLAYVLGAYTQASFSVSPSNSFVHDKDYSGFSVGGGLETALGGSWFLKAEYRFTSFDSVTVFQNTDGDFKITNAPDIHQGRIVLSYKFDFCCHDYTPLK
jgi:outer membrane immunogenic protein